MEQNIIGTEGENENILMMMRWRGAGGRMRRGKGWGVMKQEDDMGGNETYDNGGV